MQTQLERGVDWYDMVCQQLEVLRLNARKYADKDEVVPPDWFFEKVKTEIQDLRQLADFPNLPEVDVWLGPEGEIGLTWERAERSFDLIFGPKKITARLTIDLKQQLIDKKDVPSELAKFAA